MRMERMCTLMIVKWECNQAFQCQVGKTICRHEQRNADDVPFGGILLEENRATVHLGNMEPVLTTRVIGEA